MIFMLELIKKVIKTQNQTESLKLYEYLSKNDDKLNT